MGSGLQTLSIRSEVRFAAREAPGANRLLGRIVLKVLKELPVTPTRGRADSDPKVREFVGDMSREERMLVVLKRNLYDGEWDDMVADLKARLEGKPYIFKLASRITNDLERIGKLRSYETENNVDLSGYVEME